MSELHDLACAYHRLLPERLREYLRLQRGISDAVIDKHLLGWNGHRITIPIFDRGNEFAFFKLAKDPEDHSDSAKMLVAAGSHAELYGWERVVTNSSEIIICEGEFDRLVLESHGLAAVTSTAGARTFLPQWAEAFNEIPKVYVCLDNDAAGRKGALHIAALIPHARMVKLLPEVGAGGDLTDFFVRLGKKKDEFITLLQASRRPRIAEVKTDKASLKISKSSDPSLQDLKDSLPLEQLAARYLRLNRTGANLIACCPFHDDRSPSFVIYIATQRFYCFGCQAQGDVFSFLMQIEQLTFREALKLIRKLAA